MSWWLFGLSLIGVIAAGVLVGLLIGYFILKLKKKYSTDYQTQTITAVSLINASSGSLVAPPPPEVESETNDKSVALVDNRVEAYLTKLKNAPPDSVSSKSKKPAALIEVENNFAIANRPMSNQLVIFHTDIWSNKRSEFDLFNTALLGS